LNNESVINGIVLSANGGVGMAPGLINGELIATGNIQIVSGASVVTPPTQTVPGPESMTLAVLGGLGMASLVWHTSRRRATQTANALAA
jgi:hypothetical protein